MILIMTGCRPSNSQTGCPVPEIPKDQTLTLEQLVDFYLNKKISNKEGDLLTHKGHLEKFLSSLEDLTAYICELPKRDATARYDRQGYREFFMRIP